MLATQLGSDCISIVTHTIGLRKNMRTTTFGTQISPEKNWGKKIDFDLFFGQNKRN